jgi:hypothetical protein
MNKSLGLLCVRVPEDVFDSTADVSLVAGHEGVPELQLLRQTLIEQLIISPTLFINFVDRRGLKEAKSRGNG